MNLKVLFVVFLCLFSASIICNVAMIMPNATEGWGFKTFRRDAGYLVNNGIRPTGDPVGGNGWP